MDETKRGDGRRRRYSFRKLWRDRKASSIVEFGLLTPIFFGVLGASVDLGQAVLTQFKLSSTLETASSYALNSVQQWNITTNPTTPAPVSSGGGASFASTLAQLAANAIGSNWTDVTVVVNNGPTTKISGGTTTNSGTASNADLCYCPSGSGASMAWNASVTCGNSCNGGGVAGKFVRITVSRAYSPLLLPSPMVAQNLTATSIIQVQ